tara:strand:- start:359 stop:838 length:480 start_codon:yes stop_codon:yes gene_type:complete
MSNDNQHCDRMIAELVNRMENLSLIKTENPKKNSRIIYPNKSKLETYINILLKDILKDYNYTLYWSVRLNEYKRAPYDFGIYDNDNNDIIALIEIDGDQHYNRNNYLHKNDESFNNISKKNEIAKSKDIPLYRIKENSIRKENKNKIINDITFFIDNLN